MGLPPIDDTSWPQEIAEVVEQFMVSEAKFYVVGNSSAVLTTKARVQPIRAVQNADSEVTWGTKRAVRIQVPLTAATGIIKKGLAVQVTGPGDPTISKTTFIVQSAINSSHAAVRTIYCETEVTETPRVGA